jgi:hypothetical protein
MGWRSRIADAEKEADLHEPVQPGEAGARIGGEKIYLPVL